MFVINLPNINSIELFGANIISNVLYMSHNCMLICIASLLCTWARVSVLGIACLSNYLSKFFSASYSHMVL